MKIRISLIAVLSAVLVYALTCCTAHEHDGVEIALAESVKAEGLEIHPLPAEWEEKLMDEPWMTNRIDDCIITYYCCELRPHICGTGDGITASGAPVEAGVSCAVDPSLIPLGSKVVVDFGDGEVREYIAQDIGAWVNGAHIDLAVASHDEALQLGRRSATVYWTENK